MKKLYFAPSIEVHYFETCAMLCGSTKASVDGTSINKETEETMSVKGSSATSSSINWDDWE